MKKRFILFFAIFIAFSFTSLYAGQTDLENWNESSLDQENELMDSMYKNVDSAESDTNEAGAGISTWPTRAVSEIYYMVTGKIRDLLSADFGTVKEGSGNSGVITEMTGTTQQSKARVSVVFKLFLTFFYILSLTYMLFRKLTMEKVTAKDFVRLSFKVIVCLIIFSKLAQIPDYAVSLAQRLALYLVGSDKKTFTIAMSCVTSDAAAGFWLAIGSVMFASGAVMIAPGGLGMNFEIFKNFGMVFILDAVAALVGGGLVSMVYATFCLNLYIAGLIAVFYMPAMLFSKSWRFDLRTMFKFFFASFLQVFIMTFEILIIKMLAGSDGLITASPELGSLLFMFPPLTSGCTVAVMVVSASLVNQFLAGLVPDIGDTVLRAQEHNSGSRGLIEAARNSTIKKFETVDKYKPDLRFRDPKINKPKPEGPKKPDERIIKIAGKGPDKKVDVGKVQSVKANLGELKKLPDATPIVDEKTPQIGRHNFGKLEELKIEKPEVKKIGEVNGVIMPKPHMPKQQPKVEVIGTPRVLDIHANGSGKGEYFINNGIYVNNKYGSYKKYEFDGKKYNEVTEKVVVQGKKTDVPIKVTYLHDTTNVIVDSDGKRVGVVKVVNDYALGYYNNKKGEYVPSTRFLITTNGHAKEIGKAYDDYDNYRGTTREKSLNLGLENVKNTQDFNKYLSDNKYQVRVEKTEDIYKESNYNGKDSTTASGEEEKAAKDAKEFLETTCAAAQESYDKNFGRMADLFQIKSGRGAKLSATEVTDDLVKGITDFGGKGFIGRGAQEGYELRNKVRWQSDKYHAAEKNFRKKGESKSEDISLKQLTDYYNGQRENKISDYAQLLGNNFQDPSQADAMKTIEDLLK